MKLMLLAAVVGAAVARPNGFQPNQPLPNQPLPNQPQLPEGMDGDEFSSPMPAPELEGFMSYLDGLRKIFANPKNHAKLQEYFQSPEMAQWFFQRFHTRPSVPFPAHLRTNYQDSVFSKEEFQAWYPTLVQILKTMNMDAVVAEEFSMADTNGDQKVEPEEVYTMLRDGVANEFFPSFMALAFHESTKHMPGPFWSAAKRDFFQRGIWGQIAGLRPISDKAIKQLADEIEKMQGPETAEKFMVDMGMGSEASGASLPVQSKDGQGQVEIEVLDAEVPEAAEKPTIDPSATVPITNGQQMPAMKVAEDETLVPVEGALVPVNMPDGKVVMMPLGEKKDEDEPQPMATLETPTGETFQMPVVSTTANGDGTSTTKVLTPDGNSMEVSLPTPKEEAAGIANDEALGGFVAGPATIEDKSKGLEVPATATAAEPSSEAAQVACVGLDACKPTEITANGIKMTIPVETDAEEEVKMVVENVQTGQAIELKQVETELNGVTGELTVEGKTDDDTTMVVKIPAADPKSLDSDTVQINPFPLTPATIAIKDDNDEPLITAQVDSIQSAKLPNGARETTLTGNINGSPTKITITSGEAKEAGPSDIVAPEDLSADEMAEMKMEVKIEGKPAQEIPVVEANGETITGQMPDGTKVEVPAPEKLDEDETIELESPNGQKMELPIVGAQTTPDKSAEQIVASNGQAKMTVTVTGA